MNAAVLGDFLDLTHEIHPIRNVDSARYETSQTLAISFSSSSEHWLHD